MEKDFFRVFISQITDRKDLDELLQKDEIYQNDCIDSQELYRQYSMLELEPINRRIIDDYLACLESKHHRANDIYYSMGIRDAILFMSKLGLIKN